MTSETFFVLANEDELNELLAGASPRAPNRLGMRFDGKIPNGTTGVIMQSGIGNDPPRPLVLISRTEDQRRLFGRFATLRSELSPLSTWCYVVDSSLGAKLNEGERRGDLNGFEAAWTGLVVAEALLLADRSVRKLRLPACLATQTFAIARSLAIWGSSTQREVLDRFDSVQKLMRSNTSSASRMREAFQPIWGALAAATSGDVIGKSPELRPIVEALMALDNARRHNMADEAEKFAAPLIGLVPEAKILGLLKKTSPEDRLRLFDALVGPASVDASASARRNPTVEIATAMLAGYVATVAAGGAPSLSLAEEASRPEVVAWAYAIGGVGERVVWTSSFDGLGRLVVRELVRAFRSDEQPSCDFSIEEAQVLVDPGLSDPFVKLRIKQSRSVSVALLPGVNVLVSLSEPPNVVEQRPDGTNYASRSKSSNVKPPPASLDVLPRLAEGLWPYLQPYILDLMGDERSGSRGRSKKRDVDERGQRKLLDP